ncbi:MAG: SDR family oxidoreductase [Anaerolineales bacterium]
MRALVTGGAGFIGSNIVKLLLEEGHTVVVLDDLSSGFRSNLDPFPQVEFIEGDVRDPVSVSNAAKKVNVIFHLAASVGNRRSIDNPVQDSQINVIGTLNILEAARNVGVKKVVYSSSAGIFGELKYLPITEDHPTEPDTPYGVSKLAAEKLCLVYAKLYALEAICLRYFNVYGVNQRYDAYGNVMPIFARWLLNGQPLVIYDDGEQTRDFVNVVDVAWANLLAAQVEGVSGVFNIASGTAITINHLATLMRSMGETDVGVEYQPPRQGDVRHSLADISKAGEMLGYQPRVTIEAGLKEYMAWAVDEMR